MNKEPQKRDLYGHKKVFESWKDGITKKYIEDGLTKENSKLFTEYLTSLGQRKSLGYVNRNKSKLKSIFKGLQNKGIKDVSKITEKQAIDYFVAWCQNHSVDYPKRFKAFWNWLRKERRREGIIINEIEIDLKDFSNGNKEESPFVWITKEEFDDLRRYFDEDKQTILLFCFDTIIRAPTELLSLKVENIYEKNGEVWVHIPQEISKTIGRKFNLVYSGEAILNYIKKKNLKPEDYLFSISPSMFNKEMQEVAKQIFGSKKSEGGEYFKNITMYDLRHSGSIHFRQLFQKTGQSLDLLRERGGWSDFKMINYYTRRLGLDGYIHKEKLLLNEDKTHLETEVQRLNSIVSHLTKEFNKLALNTELSK